MTVRTAEDVSTVPLFNLALALEPLRGQAVEVFERIWSSGRFTFGPELVEFEQRYAEYCGAAYCVGVSNGTAALQLGLQAIGVTAGAPVITVPNTFVGTVEAIAAAGGRPVFVDVGADDRCMDPALLGSAIAPEVAAVIPVHLFGRLARVEPILKTCAQLGVPVLEDAAQAHGASRGGTRAGAWGAAAGFSFYPTKNLGAAGDAGAVVSSDPELADVVRSLRHHGSAPDDANTHLRVGRTARLDNLHAALLALRLERLDEENEQRRRAAALYRELLAELPLTLPAPDAADERQVYHLFVVEVDDRDRVLADLRASGVMAAIHYPTPVHLQPAWRDLGYARGDFPVAERLSETCLSLPCFPGITEGQQHQVALALQNALEGAD